MSYNFGGVESEPLTCLVYGYVRGIDGEPIKDVNVKFEIQKAKDTEYKEADSNVILSQELVITTDEFGYFSTPLIRTSEYEGEDDSYKVTISKEGVESSEVSGAKLLFLVPDSDTKDLTTLLTGV